MGKLSLAAVIIILWLTSSCETVEVFVLKAGMDGCCGIALVVFLQYLFDSKDQKITKLIYKRLLDFNDL
jgi:hypothetical protein